MKCTRVFALALFAAVSCGVSAQEAEAVEAADSAVRKTEVREVETFSQVEIDGLFNVRFVKGDKSKVELSSEKMESFEDVKVVCKSGILVMEYQSNMPYVGVSNIKRMDLDVTITTPSIERLKCSGVVSFETGETLNGGNVRLSLNGVSNISIAAVEGNELRMEDAGVSKVKIGNVAVKEVNVHLTGAGSTAFDSIAATEVDMEMSGAGKIGVGAMTATDVELEMSGVGSIDAKGVKADKLTVEAPGVGSITVEGEVKSYIKGENLMGKINDSKLKR